MTQNLKIVFKSVHIPLGQILENTCNDSGNSVSFSEITGLFCLIFQECSQETRRSL
jgi:hypothetical protein